MKFLLLSIISIVSIAGANPLEKNVLLKEIMSLPPNLFYEESKDSFQKRVEQGKFWVDQEEKIAYLCIKGDGTFGKRLFILDKNLNLHIIHLCNDDEGGNDYIMYKYDRVKKTATFIGSFKQSLFDSK